MTQVIFHEERIDVVVVNWNAGLQLRDCIDSCIEHGRHLISSLIVVDNGSTDGSEHFIEKVANVQLIRSGSNLGFGKACNLGAKNCKSPFILFLNPDACIYKETLDSVIRFMSDEKNTKVGICGVQLEDKDGHIARSCSRFPTVQGLIFHSIGIGAIFPRTHALMAEWDHLNSCEVDQVIGAFFCVRRSLFLSLNGFDERFFVYFEEVDFARRARMSGWKSFYLSDVTAFHLGGGTSDQVKAKRLFYSLRSRILYSFKHFSRLGAFCVLFFTLFVEVFTRSGLAISRLSISSLKETLAGYLLLYKWGIGKIFSGFNSA